MSEWLTLIAPVFVGLIMALPGVLAYLNQQARARTESNSALVSSALSLHERLQLECEELTADVARLRAERDEAESRVWLAQEEAEQCRSQLRELGRLATVMVHQAMGHGLQPVVGLEEVVALVE